ncbi:MAG: hypothetical protein WC269_03525 [Candidatus Gracilibacteria bacterium]|jgi:hypothetical protein
MINDTKTPTNQNITTTTTITSTTDPHAIHRQFVQLGRERNKITYKLLALLPKIYKQKIYASEGYSTIYEYAGKLAGLPHSVVEKALKLENKLQNKPHLQKAIETQGIHKVAIVAHLATPENEQMFADKVENMSKSALIELRKELRMETKKWPKEEKQKMKIELDDEMEFLFFKLKNKFGKKLSNKEALRKMLKVLEQNTLQNFGSSKLTSGAKEQKNTKSIILSKKSRDKFDKKRQNDARIQTNRITRYIRIVTKQAALEITNGKCAYESCNRPYEIFHHQIPFSQNHTHDSIVPLCKIHHEFAHNGLADRHETNEPQLSQADLLYRKYRQFFTK